MTSDVTAWTVKLSSTSGCQLDSDCTKGAFCFHNTCTKQCDENTGCDDGYVCSLNTGRCVSQSSLTKKNLRDLKESNKDEVEEIESNIKESEASNIISSVIGQKDSQGNTIEKIDFLLQVPTAVQASKGDKTVKVSFTTYNELGTVQYILKDANENEASVLQTAEVEKKSVNVGSKTIDTYVYSFTLPSEKAGSENPENETYTIDSSAGKFVVTVKPRANASGVYSGYVSPRSVLSGIELPLRMAIKTVPETPSSFSDIESIEIMLPASGNDLFSPETPSDSEVWVSVSASKTPSSQCKSEKPCFAAVFSSNDFTVPGSKLISADAKMNRSIRVELTDYDNERHSVMGLIIDDLTGLYRVKDVSSANVDRTWNVADMVGDFSLNRDNELPENTKKHEAANMESGLRDINSEPTAVCNDNSVNDLFKLVPKVSKKECSTISGCSQTYLDDCEKNFGSCTADEIEACKESLACKAEVEEYNSKAKNCAITSAEGYNTLSKDEKTFCLLAAADAIVSDPSRLSAILEGVLTDDGDQTEAGFPVDKTCNENGEIHTFSEFAKACSKEGCGLCADRPEVACAADLIARIYLGLDKDTAVEDKASLMNSWLDLMHESYLGQQYVAWSEDTQIRRDWLEGAIYTGTFAASVMDDFNENLLKRYRTNVLDAHHSVVSKQFTQTSLEMLGQALEDTSAEGITKLSSSRNAVLSELADTWQGLAEGLALSARRHDILTQNDAKRIQTASELRTYLFDLYFAGLVESNINLAADQGSLNAAFGANLSNIISKIESLDQGFESLVFMRDGEVFLDTRLQTDTTTTALGTVQKAAGDSVQKAVSYRKEVFNAQDAKELNASVLEDNYRTSLESMRSELVDLCGYPADCADKANCAINTQLYFCGFSVDSSDDEGGKLGDETFPVSKNDDVQTSQAGLAILEYRQALYEYNSAKSELDAFQQKLLNNEAYYKSFKENIETWNKNRLELIDNIKNDLEAIKTTEGLIGEFDSKILDAQVKATQDSAKSQSDAFDQWEAVASTKLANSSALASAAFAFGEAARWTEFAASSFEGDQLTENWGGLLTNTSIMTGGATSAVAAASSAHNTAIKALNAVTYGMQSAQEAANLARDLSEMSFSYGIDHIDRSKDVDLAEIQEELQNQIKAIKSDSQKLSDGNEYKLADLEEKLRVLENDIETLKLSAEQQEQYGRDCNELKALRTELDNLKLDNASKQYMVFVKQIGVYKALMNYLNIVQHAELVEGQYNTKNARYQNTMNLANAPAGVFQYAKDLETVEYFIESARNDLSDYLAAVEYLTVRPFVELRRSIYTARGTNELEKLYEQIKDLTNSCGSGAESKNQVTISLRNRMGIDSADYNGLTPADRFHYSMQVNELPISTQTRYIVGSSVADKLIAGSFYNASFNLSSSFANIANSCNAKIDEIEVRFVSKPGKKIRETGDAAPSVTLFYGGQSQLLSCHSKIKAITSSIGSRTTYGEYSTFNTDPFGDGINVSLYDVPADANYALTQDVEFNSTTRYSGMKGYPLMATYTVLFDPNIGENKGINWDNVADVEIRISYTTGTLGQNSDKCQYDI